MENLLEGNKNREEIQIKFEEFSIGFRVSLSDFKKMLKKDYENVEKWNELRHKWNLREKGDFNLLSRCFLCKNKRGHTEKNCFLTHLVLDKVNNNLRYFRVLNHRKGDFERKKK
jgi:hypothetical protein